MIFERRQYHGLIPPEQLRKDVIKGVAGIIISQDGKVLFGTEMVDKPATQKRKGDVSIPFETLKPKELELEGRLVSALLTEITTDESMPNIRGRLDSAGVIDQVEVFPGDWVATLLLKFKGKSDFMPFRATHPEEFSDLHWGDAQTLIDLPNLRTYAKPVLERYMEITQNRNKIRFEGLYLDPYNPSIYEAARDMESDVEVGGLAVAMGHLLTKDIPYKL